MQEGQRHARMSSRETLIDVATAEPSAREAHLLALQV